MDKKRLKESARVEWQKEQEARRRARNLKKQPQERSGTAAAAAPDREVITQSSHSR
jgi:hypothetical protein